VNSASEITLTALVFLKTKKKTLNFSWEQCEWINSLALVFQNIYKKKIIHFSEQCYSGAMLHCWGFSQTGSSKMVLLRNLWCHMGPTCWKHFYFLNQTFISVAAGEPHQQPHYKTSTSFQSNSFFSLSSSSSSIKWLIWSFYW